MFIHEAELEQIANRVWNAKSNKATRFDKEKCATFGSMGYQGMSTEFPMRSYEWVSVNDKFDMKVTYPKWDIPAYIWVRKARKES